MNVKEKKKIFNIILIGGGSVSTGLKKDVFTSLPNHYSSVISFNNNKFKVKGIIEKDLTTRKLIKDKIKILCFKSIKEIKKASCNDIFVICTPPNKRFNIIKELVDLNAKTIICEKPLCINYKESQSIAKIIKKNNVNFFTNFHRRTITNLIVLKGKLKNCVAINVHYNNGLHNYASHAIDLINFYFGKLKYVKYLEEKKISTKPDSSISFYGMLDNDRKVTFHSYDKIKYDLFDIEFVCKDKRITLKTGGVIICEEKPIKNNFYEGYKHLKVIKTKNKKNRDFKELYYNLYHYMVTGKKNSLCNIEDACYVVKVCDKVKKSFKNGKKIYI